MVQDGDAMDEQEAKREALRSEVEELKAMKAQLPVSGRAAVIAEQALREAQTQLDAIPKSKLVKSPQQVVKQARCDLAQANKEMAHLMTRMEKEEKEACEKIKLEEDAVAKALANVEDPRPPHREHGQTWQKELIGRNRHIINMCNIRISSLYTW